MHISSPHLVWLLVLAIGAVPPVFAEKRKLTGPELKPFVDSRRMWVGITDHGWAFIVINQPGGIRDVYVNNFFGTAVERKDTASIRDDRICTVRGDTGQERCFDIYHVNDNKYEGWLDGKPYTSYEVFNYPVK